MNKSVLYRISLARVRPPLSLAEGHLAVATELNKQNFDAPAQWRSNDKPGKSSFLSAVKTTIGGGTHGLNPVSNPLIEENEICNLKSRDAYRQAGGTSARISNQAQPVSLGKLSQATKDGVQVSNHSELQLGSVSEAHSFSLG